jgi:histone H3/H4
MSSKTAMTPAELVTAPKPLAKRIKYTFNSYINNLLKTLDPPMRMTYASRMQLNMFIKCLSVRLAAVALQITHSYGRCLVKNADVETAIRIVFPDGMSEKVIKKAQEAVETYIASENNIRNKAKRCNLQIPPFLSEKFLRQQGSPDQISASKLLVQETAPVYMSAAIEYVVHRMLELSADKSIRKRVKTINIRHLFLGTRKDEHLGFLMNALNINWLGAGVTPHIQPQLLPDKVKRRKMSEERRKRRIESGETPTPIGARRALPGMRALQDIRRYQKTFGPLMCKGNFMNLVKLKGDELWDDGENKLYYKANVIHYMQLFVEERLTHVCSEAVRAMIHAGRESLDLRDINFVWEYICPKGFVSVSDIGTNILHEPSIQRVALRGGVKRINSNCYFELNKIAVYYVTLLFRSTFLLLKRHDLKMVSLEWLRKGAALEGINLPIELIKTYTSKRNNVKEESEAELDGEEMEEEEDEEDEEDDEEVEDEEEKD